MDSILPGLTNFIGSFPYFWLAMVALYFLGFKLDWFPMSHAYSDYLSPGLTWEFIGSVMTAPGAAGGNHHPGFGGRLADRHAQHHDRRAGTRITSPWPKPKACRSGRSCSSMPCATPSCPTITQFGMSIGFILGGQILTEMVFSYPGLGFYLVRAVTAHDYPLMQALFLMITAGSPDRQLHRGSCCMYDSTRACG